MKKNMGSMDRVVWLVIAAMFVALYITNFVTGTFGIILLVVAIVFMLTSVISFCPLYTLIGVNTCKTK